MLKVINLYYILHKMTHLKTTIMFSHSRSRWSTSVKSVFFNLFFEAEPFAAILIAHGTHGHSQKFV